jgi:hypothetical protein
MKETHYFVRTPEYRLSDYWTESEKTQYFSNLVDAKRFIKRQISYVKKNQKGIMLKVQLEDIEYLNYLENFKTKALKKLSLVEPIPFEVEVPEYI